MARLCSTWRTSRSRPVGVRRLERLRFEAMPHRLTSVVPRNYAQRLLGNTIRRGCGGCGGRRSVTGHPAYFCAAHASTSGSDKEAAPSTYSPATSRTTAAHLTRWSSEDPRRYAGLCVPRISTCPPARPSPCRRLPRRELRLDRLSRFFFGAMAQVSHDVAAVCKNADREGWGQVTPGGSFLPYRHDSCDTWLMVAKKHARSSRRSRCSSHGNSSTVGHQKTAPLTQVEFSDKDFAKAERIARRLGYKQTAYTTTSALWGLFCLPDRATQRRGCIIKTRELGLMFVQDLEDLLMENI